MSHRLFELESEITGLVIVTDILAPQSRFKTQRVSSIMMILDMSINSHLSNVISQVPRLKLSTLPRPFHCSIHIVVI
jgi:hypothetical protein